MLHSLVYVLLMPTLSGEIEILHRNQLSMNILEVEREEEVQERNATNVFKTHTIHFNCVYAQKKRLTTNLVQQASALLHQKGIFSSVW